MASIVLDFRAKRFIDPKKMYLKGKAFSMFEIIFSGGMSVFGFSVDPALFVFGLIALIFGGLNILEFKRFD